ncbi:YugE family protein [Metabacillus sp. GX 13764]|uniref:DUF1871 family protein n=1 Tax=Metabacillus kandeliae TaxID=2900151 RepID=UPI001E39E1CA|nr:DUF1871 family protein [Metabacillus kandeliae]MCD7035749.1 YugE family protein [Metabacillus kandeliae]
METRQANGQMMELLLKWDPLHYGEGFYETEAVDVIGAVHTHDNPGELAETIQKIYEFSFEQWIPLKECQSMANQLLIIKNQASCDL